MELDSPLWERSALGTVGPPGLITRFLSGDGASGYLPLEDAHLVPPAVPDDVAPMLHSLRGRAELAAIFPLATKAPSRLALPHIPDDHWLATIIRPPGQLEADGFGLAYLMDMDRRVAVIDHVWTGYPKTSRAARVAMGGLLLHQLARAGALGVLTRTQNGDLFGYLTKQLPGFRSLGTVLRQHGVIDDDGAISAAYRYG